ncbi:phosphoribosylanthranilate isomerase [Striga asiatica]|uniref:Phosphoribosylanthranilate isomerase n=1 Tax=Striga asiatica TaxID=4170 RepID=A0A5A7Q109_STRAF|nr:phosphoribosylanthranilate isomerase [Striga asiatica]
MNGKGFNWSRFKLPPIKSKRGRLFTRGIKPENMCIKPENGCCLEMYTTTNLLQILFQFIRRQSHTIHFFKKFRSKYRGTPLKIESPRINCVRRPSTGYGSSISPAVEGEVD